MITVVLLVVAVLLIGGFAAWLATRNPALEQEIRRLKTENYSLLEEHKRYDDLLGQLIAYIDANEDVSPQLAVVSDILSRSPARPRKLAA